MSDEIKAETIERTQKLLGKYVSKPPLTEKLLRKPPFRFLHDIVTAVVRDTGFLKGLYSESELISDNVKEREAKLVFLTKLIDAIKSISKIEVSAKPSKIIAGLEPTETNKLLQAVAMALDKNLDISNYVKGIKSNTKVRSNSKTIEKDRTKKTIKSNGKPDRVQATTRSKKPEASEENTKTEKNKKKESIVKEEKHVRNVEKLHKIEEKSKRSRKLVESKQAGKDAKEIISVREEHTKLDVHALAEHSLLPKESTSDITKSDDLEPQESDVIQDIVKDDELVNIVSETPKYSQNEQISEAITVDEVSRQTSSRSVRPKSARPHSGDLRMEREKPAKMIEEQKPKNEVPARPMSSLRPPSVRPSSARPGAPRLRSDSTLPLQENIPLGKINVIVENFSNQEADEEETVVIRTVEPASKAQPMSQILDIPSDKGHLVEQILEQIHEDDVAEHAKSKIDIDWEQEGFPNRNATSREIAQLRSSIQALTRVANPLGKLMNYLHEDVEAMHSELTVWTNMKRQIWNEIRKQERINEEASKPLRAQLNELEEGIRKQEEEIRSVLTNILQNEMRIKEFYSNSCLLGLDDKSGLDGRIPFDL